MKHSRPKKQGCLITVILAIGGVVGLLTGLILEIKGKTDASEVAAGIGVLCLIFLFIDIFIFKYSQSYE